MGISGHSTHWLSRVCNAFGNDVNPEYVFAQLVFALGRTGDVLAALSTSGNASNVCRAAEVARAKGLPVLALTEQRRKAQRTRGWSVFVWPAAQNSTRSGISSSHLSLSLADAGRTFRKALGTKTELELFVMTNSNLQSPLFFERNRVFRVYEGGKLFHDFFGDEAVDGNLPEEWIASKVKALNREMRAPDEGLSKSPRRRNNLCLPAC